MLHTTREQRARCLVMMLTAQRNRDVGREPKKSGKRVVNIGQKSGQGESDLLGVSTVDVPSGGMAVFQMVYYIRIQDIYDVTSRRPPKICINNVFFKTVHKIMHMKN